GAGLDGWVGDLRVFDDGRGPALYVAGGFRHAGGVPAAFIARWDGRAWSPLGSGMNRPVEVLCTFDDGRGPALYAAGEFVSAGGAAASRIAKWDAKSETWSPLGPGTNDSPYSLYVFDDGRGPALYAG